LNLLSYLLAGDKAYDIDPLDCDLAERYGIEMIAPHRGVRRSQTQDGRPLRRYRNVDESSGLSLGSITLVGW
jgi:hypothetical protein